MRSCLAMTPHDLERLTLRRRKERGEREASLSSPVVILVVFIKERRSRRRHFISQKMKWGCIKCRRLRTVPRKSGNYSRVASKSQQTFCWEGSFAWRKKSLWKTKGQGGPSFPPLLPIEMSFFPGNYFGASLGIRILLFPPPKNFWSGEQPSRPAAKRNTILERWREKGKILFA